MPRKKVRRVAGDVLDGHELLDVALSDMNPAPYNPRDMDDAARAGLGASIDQFGLLDLIIWNRQTGHIVGGHQRYQHLLAKGETVTTAVVVDWPLDKEKAANIALNNPQIHGHFTDGLKDILSEIRDSDKGLMEDLRFSDLAVELNLDLDSDTARPTFDEAALVTACDGVDRIAVAFSGGRDSSLAAFWAISRWPNKVDLVFVDTGVEFPDIEPFVHDFARHFNVPVHRIRTGPTFFDVFGPSATFPAPRGRSCMHSLIWDPINSFDIAQSRTSIRVAGGTPSQRQHHSSTNSMFEKRVDDCTIRIVNPLYVVDIDALSREFHRGFHMWPGYKHGFNRTACWCCPFQRPSQYDALRQVYPVLYERLMAMAATWRTFDSNLERYYRSTFKREAIHAT